MKKRKIWMRAVALSLCTVLLLAGCSGGGEGGGDKSEKKTDVSSSSSPDKSEGEKTKDYSKYNAYLELAEEINDEIEPVLMVYFENVDFAEEFAVVGDYGAIKDAVQFYTSHTYTAEKALDYAGEEPLYPEVDSAVRALGNSPVEVMEALDKLASYMRFDDYVDDNMAKAPEIHAQLWEALQSYDAYCGSFLDALSVMANESRDEDRAELLEDGEMILYHSLSMIHASEDILDGIWEQIEAANAETGPEEELILPVVDMTDLSPLFNDFQTAYDGLNQAIETEAEREKIRSFTGKVGDSAIKLYTNKVNSLYSRVGTLADAVMNGTDYAEAFDSVNEAVGSMIDGYNGII